MRGWIVRLAALVAIAAGVPVSGAGAPPVRDGAVFRQVMLDGHNAARGVVGLPPLSWDQTLADAAGAHAAAMARSGRFGHGDGGASGQGENLWMGTRGGYGYAEMLGHWVAEGHDFVDAPTPAFSRTGQWSDVGHFSQIMWRRTTRVGCAMVSGPTDDYLVCRYSPAGNVMGQRPY